MNDREKLIKCPGCDLLLSESDGQGQVNHMTENHPEIIAERLREAGMHDEALKFRPGGILGIDRLIS